MTYDHIKRAAFNREVAALRQLARKHGRDSREYMLAREESVLRLLALAKAAKRPGGAS